MNNINSEIAVFSVSVATGLIERGFEVVGQTEQAWFFEDQPEVEEAITELVEALLK